MRRRLALSAVCLVTLLAVAAPAQAFVVHLKAPNHHPTAGKRWPIKVTARTGSGTPLHAKASYKFLFQGQVVATRYPSPHGPTTHHPYKFFGHFRDASVTWPKRSVGIRLTFRVIVKAKGHGKEHADFRVKVHN